MSVSTGSLLTGSHPSKYICPSCRHTIKCISNARPRSAQWNLARPEQRNNYVHSSINRHKSKTSILLDRPNHNELSAAASRDGGATGISNERASIHSKRTIISHSNAGRPTLTTCQARSTGHYPRQSLRRQLQTSSPQQLELATHQPPADTSPLFLKPGSVRDRLRRWQEEHKDADNIEEIGLPRDFLTEDSPPPNPSRLGESNEDNVAEELEEVEPPDDLADADFDRSGATTVIHVAAGDLVLMNPGMGQKERFIVAVFIRKAGNNCQFYAASGRWIHASAVAVHYAIRGWASVSEIEPLLPHLPSLEELLQDTAHRRAKTEDTSVPREVGVSLVNRMLDFDREAALYYRTHAAVLDNAHDALAHDNNLRYSTISSVAMYLLKLKREELTPMILFVVSRALHQAGYAFYFDGKSHKITGLLQIRSKAQVAAVDSVVRWAREWQSALVKTVDGAPLKLPPSNPIPGFLSKARKFVLKSRETRSFDEFGTLGPSNVKRKLSRNQDSVRFIEGEKWSRDEKTILIYLQMYGLSRLFNSSSQLLAIAMMIIRRTDLYNDLNFTLETGMLFLQELGVVLPYENRLQYDASLALPISQHSKPLLDLAMTLIRQSKVGFSFRDSMKDIRHDWGNLPVYCIDGADAKEIDDGISIESAADPSQTWLRIHIANPTAFLAQDSDIAKMARHMGETVYMPDRNHMMLPPSVTSNWWSLAPDRPTLTFSARLDAEGRILETDVRSGRVHNVRRLTYNQVNSDLFADGVVARPELILTVGDGIPDSDMEKPTKLIARDAMDLQQMRAIAQTRLKFRRANGGVLLNQPRKDITVWTQWSRSGLAFTPLNHTCARIVEGDPVIRWTTGRKVNSFTEVGFDSNALVQEFMLLASEIGSLWCDQRRIPTIHRGSQDVPGVATDYKEYWQEFCAPAVEKGGELPEHLGYEYLRRMGYTALATRPMQHRILGLSHYSKVTSPLRRYGDMIFHWQAEAALREEARLGKSLVTTEPRPDRSFLPFSSVAMDTFMVSYQAREKLVSRAKYAAGSGWENLFLMRAHNFGETTLPFETLTVEIQETDPVSSGWTGCFIVELDKRAQMANPRLYDIKEEVMPGDVWEARLYRAHWHATKLIPLRLLSRYNK